MKAQDLFTPAVLATLYAGGGLLMLTNTYAGNSANSQNTSPIQINLQQAIDENCDGRADEGKSQATPNTCIIYTITATNLSDKRLFNIRLSGKIPPNTRLYKPLTVVDNDSTHLLSHQIGRDINDEGIPTVYASFDYLDSGKEHSFTVQYSVRIQQ